MPERWNYKTNIIDYLNVIDSIANPTEKEKLAGELVNQILNDFTRNVDFIIERVREIKSDVELLEVPRNLMDSLKEAIFCYVNGQYLSTIATVGITAELFCTHIYRIFLEGLKLEDIIVRRRTEEFSKISQVERIQTLFSIVGIREGVCSILKQINKKRNDNIHPHQIKDYQEDALDSLQCIIYVMNKYSEEVKISGRTPSVVNMIPVQREDDLIIGEKMAKLNMFWYLDYQCPFCRKFWEETLPKINKDYLDTNKMKVIVRHFPLTSIHPLSQLCAESVKCMDNISGFDKNNLKLQNKIFQNQDKITPENLELWVRELGCSIDFCVESGKYRDYISNSIVEAQKVGASGTPHFIIGDTPLAGAQPYELFKDVIELELQK